MTAEEIVRKLTKAQREAMITLPLPRAAKPWLHQSARTYSSIWRKSSKHWDAMVSLEERGLVERTVSRGETLWRPTRPLGLTVRDLLLESSHDQ